MLWGQSAKGVVDARGGVLLRSGEPVLVPGARAGGAHLRGARGGAGAQADVARRGAQGGRDSGPDRDTRERALPGARYKEVGRALRVADALPGAVPVPHAQDDAGGDVVWRGGRAGSVHPGSVLPLLGGGRRAEGPGGGRRGRALK